MSDTDHWEARCIAIADDLEHAAGQHRYAPLGTEQRAEAAITLEKRACYAAESLRACARALHDRINVLEDMINGLARKKGG